MSLVGRTISKEFDDGMFQGTVTSFHAPYYHVVYDDGDEEDFSEKDLRPLLKPASSQVATKKVATKKREEDEDWTPSADKVKHTGKRKAAEMKAPACNSEEEEEEERPISKKPASSLPKTSSNPFKSMLFFPGFGAIPIVFGNSGRRARGLKAAATRETNALIAEEWAAGAKDRPYQLVDLVSDDKETKDGADKFFSSLSLADTKSECKMHGLPISGSKQKLFQGLFKQALDLKYGNASRGVAPVGMAAGPTLKANGSGNADQVRRALVADLRRSISYDKKLKRPGARKMLKASYANCSPELFSELFPHAAGKKKCAVTLGQLEISSLSKSMRYGGSLDLVPGTLSAKIDENGTISMSGKYSIDGW
mmetsp:Transcript_26341/g.76802  ORF Transcript_26341/g.76802 Transcript_26341/m.76802 type:complete len:366 (-) Transcript_26341:256-1353(-)